jgi:lipopolysaccharide cholinephosphotransferase
MDVIAKNNSNNLKDAQSIMVSILDVFTEICKKHNLDYWLGYGTLLGAIRHKGFIPWDDDLDVMMPQKDYEKFLEVANLELPESIFLQTKYSDKYYKKEFAKLRDKNSRIIEHSEVKGVKYHQGLFIDIFPMIIVARKRRCFFSIVKHFFIKEYISIKYKRILPRIINLIGVIVFLIINKKWLSSIVCKFVFSDREDSLYSCGLEVPFERFIPIKDIYPLKPIEFCGKQYSGPCNPDSYLKISYGDYMQLPPIEKRETHAVSIEIFKNQPV